MNGESLYDVLNIIYSTTHNDKPEERDTGIRLLNNAMASGTDAETIITKMKQMVSLNTDSRGKLYSAILGKFWERQFNQAITYRKYNFDE